MEEKTIVDAVFGPDPQSFDYICNLTYEDGSTEQRKVANEDRVLIELRVRDYRLSCRLKESEKIYEEQIENRRVTDALKIAREEDEFKILARKFICIIPWFLSIALCLPCIDRAFGCVVCVVLAAIAFPVASYVALKVLTEGE